MGVETENASHALTVKAALGGEGSLGAHHAIDHDFRPRPADPLQAKIAHFG